MYSHIFSVRKVEAFCDTNIAKKLKIPCSRKTEYGSFRHNEEEQKAAAPLQNMEMTTYKFINAVCISLFHGKDIELFK